MADQNRIVVTSQISTRLQRSRQQVSNPVSSIIHGFYFWAVIWSYIVDLFAALHELASASARTLLKLASSVRALLKLYGDTLKQKESI